MKRTYATLDVTDLIAEMLTDDTPIQVAIDAAVKRWRQPAISSDSASRAPPATTVARYVPDDDEDGETLCTEEDSRDDDNDDDSSLSDFVVSDDVFD